MDTDEHGWRRGLTRISRIIANSGKVPIRVNSRNSRESRFCLRVHPCSSVVSTLKALAVGTFFFAFTCGAQNPAQTNLESYADFATRTEGVVARGKELFNNEQRTACLR